MSAHTKEPWRIAEDAEFGLHIVDVDGRHVAMTREAIRRVAACVNSCAGIPTETLESTRDWQAAGVATAETLKQQRDELLAALKEVVRISDRKHDAWDRAHAAIAEAEGRS